MSAACDQVGVLTLLRHELIRGRNDLLLPIVAFRVLLRVPCARAPVLAVVAIDGPTCLLLSGVAELWSLDAPLRAVSVAGARLELIIETANRATINTLYAHGATRETKVVCKLVALSSAV